jgi:hypothetical protein
MAKGRRRAALDWTAGGGCPHMGTGYWAKGRLKPSFKKEAYAALKAPLFHGATGVRGAKTKSVAPQDQINISAGRIRS